VAACALDVVDADEGSATYPDKVRAVLLLVVI
jgi:hypothetical protein